MLVIISFTNTNMFLSKQPRLVDGFKIVMEIQQKKQINHRGKWKKALWQFIFFKDAPLTNLNTLTKIVAIVSTEGMMFYVYFNLSTR